MILLLAQRKNGRRSGRKYGQQNFRTHRIIGIDWLGTLTWLRISGKAEECTSKEMKQAMLEACPILVNIYQNADNPVMTLFAIKDMKAKLYKDDGSVEVL